MTENGYTIFSLNDASWPSSETSASRSSITQHLGCAETQVDYYRTIENSPAELPLSREALSIPLDGSCVITLEVAISIPRLAITHKPAGTQAKLHSGSETTWLVVSTTTEATTDEGISVPPSDLFDFVTPTVSTTDFEHLSEPLRCRGMKANVLRLPAGESIPYHKEPTQEELYVPLDGPGHVRIAGATHEVPQNGIVKINPTVPRAAVNNGDQPRTWLMIGAPPTGGPDEWDPDVEYADWPGTE